MNTPDDKNCPEPSRGRDDLKAAEAELRHAVDDLEHAEGEVGEAEKKLKKAEAEIEEEERERHEPKVEFEDVNSLHSVDFRTSWETKLNAAWTEAARLLEEPRKPDDRLQTTDGRDLMPYLALTLRELKEKHIVKALKFQIVGPTGGA